ncbi:UDP-N-acetylglucosamine 2-epimerase (non-hydrolyzing) [Candidatus Woesearchaeota archaeon]|nr:UDP-N-acetylglucosamine 2-epimerase (non-hydrolyzing) [Candidatus Woesearchaeota archaeon]
MKIASIVGARPQFVKQAPLSRLLRKKHQEIIIHTGQHYDDNMSKIFFSELKIPEPDYNLGVGSSSHARQTAEIMTRLEPVLEKEKPDLVIVLGDTNTTAAGALTAAKMGIKTAHIEAGMRSFDRSMPEELNRIVADHLSDLLLCPTKEAMKNLKNEGLGKKASLTGDIMIDAIKEFLAIAEKKSGILKNLKLESKGYLLATIHRASNTDNMENLKSIMSAFAESREKIIFPMHPRTRKFIEKYGLLNKIKKPEIQIVEPLGYFDMLILEKNAKKILTDSGGVQKEAYFFKVPCITLRENTEWVETVKDGWNTLAGTNRKKILDAARNFNPKGKQSEDYGGGKASRKILEAIESL